MRGRVIGSCAVVGMVAIGSPLAAQSPQFRGTPEHAGVVQTEGLPHFGGVAWRFETGGTVRSTPALVDGALYVGSSDGLLYRIDAGDGRLVWSWDAGSAISSSPAVFDGRVFVTDRDGRLHAVDAEYGDPLWTQASGEALPFPWGPEGWEYFTGSAAIADGTLYWGAADGAVRAVDPATGEERWSVRTGGRIRATPAISDGLLVIGSADGYVRALDAATGTERWSFATTGVGLDSSEWGFDRRTVSASAAIRDGVVYVGGRDASLYALDAATGRRLWSVDERSAWVIGTAVAAGDRVYSTRSSSGNVRAVSAADGAELWVTAAGPFVFGSPALAGDLLHLTEGDGDFSVLDAATGEIRWSYRTGGPTYGSPVVHDGRAYLGSDDGFVYALQGTSGTPVRRAVYFDEELSRIAVFGSGPQDRTVLDHFESRGYETVDAQGLSGFLRDAVDSESPSVLVMGMDLLPGDVDLRPYLEAGGKVVWMGYPPEYLIRDESGATTGVDRAAAEAAIGVDLSAFNGDIFGSEPTEQGRRWGLRSRFTTPGTTMPAHVDDVLARDEVGRATIWVKRYGGPEGSGFVFLWPTTDRSVLAEVQRIAEHGVVAR